MSVIIPGTNHIRLQLSYTYSNRCTFDQATGDLTCGA